MKAGSTPEEREADKANYAKKLLPHSVNFAEDLDVAFEFFDAVYDGVKTLGTELSASDRTSWDNANAYLAKSK